MQPNINGHIHMCKQDSTPGTYFLGTVLTYGMTTLSTNEPKPRRKFLVMADMRSAERQEIPACVFGLEQFALEVLTRADVTSYSGVIFR